MYFISMSIPLLTLNKINAKNDANGADKRRVDSMISSRDIAFLKMYIN